MDPDLQLNMDYGTETLVPSEAVLHWRMRQVVFVVKGNGYCEPRNHSDMARNYRNRRALRNREAGMADCIRSVRQNVPQPRAAFFRDYRSDQRTGRTISGGSSIASGSTVHAFGLLFFDGGQWKMVASRIGSNWSTGACGQLLMGKLLHDRQRFFHMSIRR